MRRLVTFKEVILLVTRCLFGDLAAARSSEEPGPLERGGKNVTKNDPGVAHLGFNPAEFVKKTPAGPETNNQPGHSICSEPGSTEGTKPGFRTTPASYPGVSGFWSHF